MNMKSMAMTLVASVAFTGLMIQPAHANSGWLTTLLAAPQPENDGAPRFVSGTLVNAVFGDAAKVEVKVAGGEVQTFRVNSATVMTLGNQSRTLTQVAQTQLNKSVKLVIRRVDGERMVMRLFDDASWLSFTTSHKGDMHGSVKFFTARFIQIGERMFELNDATEFRLEGKKVGRKKLEGRTDLWVKGTVTNGVPVALIVADNAQSLGAVNGGAASTRPPSRGTGTGTGTQRPPSRGTGGTSGSERPPSRGDGQGSPTERPGNNRPAPGQNSRPPSRGSGSVSPTERAAQVQRGFAITLEFEILDSTDTKPGVVNDVVNAAAGEVDMKDMTLELYGSLQFNGQKLWEIAQKDHVPTVQQVFLVRPGGRSGPAGDFEIKAERLKLKGKLMDDDTITSSDVIFDVDLDLDLFALAGKGKQVFRKPGGKALLRVTVTAK